jgi:hypothetical protein
MMNMSKNQESQKVIKASISTEADQHWIKHQREVQQKTPERIEDAAKFLSGMISISLTIFLKLDPNAFERLSVLGGLRLATGFWLLSLLCTLLVLFPTPYRYHHSSAESIRAMHRKVVRYKYTLLALGSVLFLFALILISCSQQSSS